MKAYQILFVLVAISLASSEVQPESIKDVGLFIEGFFIGLHLENLAPSVKKCFNAVTLSYHAFQGMIYAYKNHWPFYNFMNNATTAIGTVSPTCRECASVPKDVKQHIIDDYLKKFDYSWKKYFYAVFIHFSHHTNEINEDLKLIVKYFKEKEIKQAGLISGNLFNLVFNVTKQYPSNPSPFMDLLKKQDNQCFYRRNIRINTTQVRNIHNDFRKYYNYSMIVLNYTKWVNTTTVNNLNSSVMNTEMKIYIAINEFLKPEPNIKEGILTLTDTLQYLNSLFNGIYYLIKQLPQSIFKNSVFEHIKYIFLNLLEHSGYLVWNGIRLYHDLKEDNPMDACKRIAMLFRKAFYFDQDVIDDIYSKSTLYLLPEDLDDFKID